MEKSNDRIPRAELEYAREMAVTEFKNQQFRAMSAKEKRIVIANDVLRWMEIGKIKPLPGYYLQAPSAVVDTINGYSCSACALGGLFACAVERGDAGGTVRDDVRNYINRSATDELSLASTFDGMGLYDKMSSIFSEAQLSCIECAFEGHREVPASSKLAGGATFDQLTDDGWTYPAEMQRAFEFFDKHKTPRRRMTAIMKNIIKNDGTFLP